jgi:hypothetical protein
MSHVRVVSEFGIQWASLSAPIAGTEVWDWFHFPFHLSGIQGLDINALYLHLFIGGPNKYDSFRLRGNSDTWERPR